MRFSLKALFNKKIVSSLILLTLTIPLPSLANQWVGENIIGNGIDMDVRSTNQPRTSWISKTLEEITGKYIVLKNQLFIEMNLNTTDDKAEKKNNLALMCDKIRIPIGKNNLPYYSDDKFDGSCVYYINVYNAKIINSTATGIEDYYQRQPKNMQLFLSFSMVDMVGGEKYQLIFKAKQAKMAGYSKNNDGSYNLCLLIDDELQFEIREEKQNSEVVKYLENWYVKDYNGKQEKWEEHKYEIWVLAFGCIRYLNIVSETDLKKIDDSKKWKNLNSLFSEITKPSMTDMILTREGYEPHLLFPYHERFKKDEWIDIDQAPGREDWFRTLESLKFLCEYKIYELESYNVKDMSSYLGYKLMVEILEQINHLKNEGKKDKFLPKEVYVDLNSKFGNLYL